MATESEPVVARARALIGTRFRPQGRCAQTGLDCIGLAAAALGVAGARRDYALRGGSLAQIEAELRSAGLRPAGEAEPGDVLIFKSGPAQLHLGIWTGTGLVHADLALRKVVERPGAAEWPLLGIWRRGI